MLNLITLIFIQAIDPIIVATSAVSTVKVAATLAKGFYDLAQETQKLTTVHDTSATNYCNFEGILHDVPDSNDMRLAIQNDYQVHGQLDPRLLENQLLDWKFCARAWAMVLKHARKGNKLNMDDVRAALDGKMVGQSAWLADLTLDQYRPEFLQGGFLREFYRSGLNRQRPIFWSLLSTQTCNSCHKPKCTFCSSCGGSTELCKEHYLCDHCTNCKRGCNELGCGLVGVKTRTMYGSEDNGDYIQTAAREQLGMINDRAAMMAQKYLEHSKEARKVEQLDDDDPDNPFLAKMKDLVYAASNKAKFFTKYFAFLKKLPDANLAGLHSPDDTHSRGAYENWTRNPFLKISSYYFANVLQKVIFKAKTYTKYAISHMGSLPLNWLRKLVFKFKGTKFSKTKHPDFVGLKQELQIYESIQAKLIKHMLYFPDLHTAKYKQLANGFERGFHDLKNYNLLAQLYGSNLVNYMFTQGYMQGHVVESMGNHVLDSHTGYLEWFVCDQSNLDFKNNSTYGGYSVVGVPLHMIHATLLYHRRSVSAGIKQAYRLPDFPHVSWSKRFRYAADLAGASTLFVYFPAYLFKTYTQLITAGQIDPLTIVKTNSYGHAATTNLFVIEFPFLLASLINPDPEGLDEQLLSWMLVQQEFTSKQIENLVNSEMFRLMRRNMQNSLKRKQAAEIFMNLVPVDGEISENDATLGLEMLHVIEGDNFNSIFVDTHDAEAAIVFETKDKELEEMNADSSDV